MNKHLVLPLGRSGILVKIDVVDAKRLGLNEEDELFCMLTNAGWYKADKYVRRESPIGSTAMHRVVMGLSDMDGNKTEGYEQLVVDHIDGDGYNNTRSNLRLATGRMNAQNTPQYRAHQKFLKDLEEAEGVSALRASAFREYARACEDFRRVQVGDDDPVDERVLRIKKSDHPFLEAFGVVEEVTVGGIERGI